MSKILPFTYFGSKYQSIGFINSNLPRTRQYIEPFGGAGTVLFNREPVPVETYNDLHDDIPHFFRTLRDSREELIGALKQTPYSRAEHLHAIEMRASGYPDCSDIERARLFFTILQQAHSSRPSEPSWSYAKISERGKGVDKTTSTWKNKVDDVLPDVAGRLRDVQIESRPAIEVIESHDSDCATIYVDPPYVSDTRGSDDNYDLEMDESDHEELAHVLEQCEGRVAISGYDSDLYQDLYSGWNEYRDCAKSLSQGAGSRQEVLWTNYDADELGGKKIGDWPEPRRKGQQLTLTGAIES